MRPHQQSHHQVGSTPPEIESVDRLVLAVVAAVLVIATVVGLTSTAPSSSCAAPAQVASQK